MYINALMYINVYTCLNKILRDMIVFEMSE